MSRKLIVLLATALAATSCAGSDNSVAVKEPVAAAITAESGANQSGFVGMPLSGATVVKVLDAAGNPLPGVTVHFSTRDLLSVVYPATSVSDANGLATARWTLGGKQGNQFARATVAGLADTVVFTAIALPGNPAAIRILDGDDQVATVNTTLSTPLKVIITDQFLNHVSGAVVTYTGTDGTGRTATAPTSFTDTAGVAATSWTIRGIGEQTLTARVAGTALQVTFTAYGTQAGGMAQQTSSIRGIH